MIRRSTLEKARDFYSRSPDGQYDDVVATAIQILFDIMDGDEDAIESIEDDSVSSKTK